MNKKIKEIIKETLKDYTVEKIVLFGSRARGDNREDSDYDIFVIVKENIERAKKIDLAEDILFKLAVNKICADVILRSINDVTKYKNQIGTLTREVLKEGVVI